MMIIEMVIAKKVSFFTTFIIFGLKSDYEDKRALFVCGSGFLICKNCVILQKEIEKNVYKNVSKVKIVSETRKPP